MHCDTYIDHAVEGMEISKLQLFETEEILLLNLSNLLLFFEILVTENIHIIVLRKSAHGQCTFEACERGGWALLCSEMRMDKFVAATIELMVTLGSALYYLNV